MQIHNVRLRLLYYYTVFVPDIDNLIRSKRSILLHLQMQSYVDIAGLSVIKKKKAVTRQFRVSCLVTLTSCLE